MEADIEPRTEFGKRLLELRKRIKTAGRANLSWSQIDREIFAGYSYMTGSTKEEHVLNIMARTGLGAEQAAWIYAIETGIIDA